MGQRPSFTGLVGELERVLATLEGEHYVNLAVTYVNLERGPPFPPAVLWGPGSATVSAVGWPDPPRGPMGFPTPRLLK
uniref:Uncharacterized protein n=1 Tax=Bubo bubo TaxID=30461 RepID=A0A8C0FB80_BUBBB